MHTSALHCKCMVSDRHGHRFINLIFTRTFHKQYALCRSVAYVQRLQHWLRLSLGRLRSLFTFFISAMHIFVRIVHVFNKIPIAEKKRRKQVYKWPEEKEEEEKCLVPYRPTVTSLPLLTLLCWLIKSWFVGKCSISNRFCIVFLAYRSISKCFPRLPAAFL